MLCHSEKKSSFLKHISDKHCVNFVPETHVKFKVLKHIKLWKKKTKRKAKLHLFVCVAEATPHTMIEKLLIDHLKICFRNANRTWNYANLKITFQDGKGFRTARTIATGFRNLPIMLANTVKLQSNVLGWVRLFSPLEFR